MPKHNVIVLVSDTFRYDYLGCNGNTWMGTDGLDRFADRAVCFDQHYLSSFPTIPNRTDLFTGRFSFPFHGWQNIESVDHEIGYRPKNRLPERLPCRGAARRALRFSARSQAGEPCVRPYGEGVNPLNSGPLSPFVMY